MNIPSRLKSKKGWLARLTSVLGITVVLSVSVSGCRLELSADATRLSPSINEIQGFLDRDRVRRARDEANILARRYANPSSDLVYGWALWRNGEVYGAESRFRRVVEAGLDEGSIGLAAVYASEANWPQVVKLASGKSSGTAYALLASAAWARGEADTAASELLAWNQVEPATARGRAAGSMAVAIRRFQGPPQQWNGDAVVLPIREIAEGTWVVEAKIDSEPALLKIDPTFRQSIVSERFATAASIVVDGPKNEAGLTASNRWPSIMGARQAALMQLELGTVMVRNLIVAVSDLTDDFDGVLGADVLSTARWSLSLADAEMMFSPPAQTVVADELSRGFEGRTIAWLRARVIREGLGAQILLFPRIANKVVAAGIDLSGISRLDSDLLPVAAGSGIAAAQLTLGGWRGDVRWYPASLAGWAIDGGVAPIAVIGANSIDSWALHWYPETQQLRVDVLPLSDGQQDGPMIQSSSLSQEFLH